MRTAILLRVILPGLVLTTALGASHAQQVTVQELEQVLASSVPVHAKSGDSDLQDQIDREQSLSPRIARLELKERLTGSARTRLITKYGLGPLSRSALELIADRSALLDPPASDFPALPPPDDEAQKTMIRQAGEFVFKTLTHLPDFFALLTTTQFDDGPVIASGEILTAAPGMHLVGSSRKEITFSEGKEVFDSSRMSLSSRQPRDVGLKSQGEFGAEAAIVFLDLKQGSVSFHHWESGTAGPLAVFRYAVPQSASHYEVKYDCHGQPIFHALPAYHGTLHIDPASGALVRYTLLAESGAGDPVTRVASAIDYGAVVLGDRHYFCPVRSLAFMVEEADTCSDTRRRKLDRPVAMLNRIIFTDYHKLGSEMVIVPATPQTPNP